MLLLTILVTSVETRNSDYRTCLYDSPTLETPDTLKTEPSIGSSNISDLISDIDRRKSAGIYSLYSTVNKSRKKHRNQAEHFAKATKRSNDYGYESLDDLDNNDNNHEKTLTTDNARQNEIIYQISKAVSVCRNHSGFFGSDIFVEAEKILLIASLRKEVNDDELKKLDYEEIEQHLTSSSVTIKNLEIYSKPHTIVTKNKNYDWHWVCIIRHGSTVYATKSLRQEDKTISFPDTFHFEGLPSDFEIHVSIYGLMLKNKKNKKIKSCSQLKTVPSSSSDSTQSYFTLWGTTMIKPCQSNQTVFNLVQAIPGAPITDILKLNVETIFSIHVREIGFLTIGLDYKGYPVWNRKWCSLNGSRLRYWNYPNEEQHCEPLGELDLLNCFSKEIQRAPKDICPYPRTLLIHMNGCESTKSVQTRYFLAADNLADLERWQESLNLVLSYLRKWNDYDCFLEN